MIAHLKEISIVRCEANDILQTVLGNPMCGTGLLAMGNIGRELPSGFVFLDRKKADQLLHKELQRIENILEHDALFVSDKEERSLRLLHMKITMLSGLLAGQRVMPFFR